MILSMRPRALGSRLSIAAILTATLLWGCRDAPRSGTTAPSPPTPSVAATATQTEAPAPEGCGAMTESQGPDVLRPMVSSGSSDVVVYANAQVGLAIVDVADPDEPRIMHTSEFVGTPVGVFELSKSDGAAAVVVYAPWDRPTETIIRAVDTTRSSPTLGKTLGELRLSGGPRDAHRIGEIVVVTRDVPNGGGPMTAVTTFMLEQGKLVMRDELRLLGQGSVTGASPQGVAVARQAEVGPDRSLVTWIGVSQRDHGVLQLHGTAAVNGVVPRWRRSADHVVDVTEDSFVRVVACATEACPGNGASAATYSGIDFSEPDQPRLAGFATIARAGDAVFGFDGSRLFVARPAPGEAARNPSTTELAAFRTEGDLEPLGTLNLRGTVASLSVRPRTLDDEVIALGWTGSASAGKRAVLSHVDTRRGPRLIGSTSFGGDWTWSPAYDDERAVSFDPLSTLAALPMTTMRGPRGAAPAVQVFSLEGSGPRALLEREMPAADRLLFVRGRLLAFSSEGVLGVRYPTERRLNPLRRWDDHPSVGEPPALFIR